MTAGIAGVWWTATIEAPSAGMKLQSLKAVDTPAQTSNSTLAASGGGALRPSYEISTGGTKRHLTLVADEIAVKQPDGRRTITKFSGTDLATEAKSVRSRSAPASEVELVLTEKDGGPKAHRGAEKVRHYVTRQVLVKLKDGATGETVAKSADVKIASQPGYAPGYVILDATTSEGALVAMEILRAQPDVESAEVLLATQKAKKFTPNDPLFSEQWHHRNTTQLGGALWIDTNITTAWDSYKGTGITIGIVDDGVEHTHPDIQPNYNTAIDFDFNSNDADPAPVDLVADSHGTACAGVAAARGNNGIGVSGAAPEATLAGFRLIAAANTDQNEADAFLLNNDVIHVKSNSWGWPDGSGYGGPGALATAALETGITSGRGGKGVIYVFAGGNGFYDGDNSNMDGYAGSPYVIAVAAVNDFGFQSYYSELGANLLISAPSSGGLHNEGIRTTDLTGEGGDNNTTAGTSDLADRNYTNRFSGTSSACPLVSGIVALILQANPNLGWRDVQEILIHTARKNHRTDPEWATNAAGLSFNHKYGAGMIDAAAAVALAQQWTNLPALSTTQVSQTGLAVAIPDNSSTGVTRTLNFATANFRVEHVTVTVNATHTARGDLEVILTSPSGMVSKLANASNDGSDNLSWTYSSVRHWGETAAGNWTVKVADRVLADAGTLTAVTIKLLGTTNAAARIAGASATLSAEGNLPANTAADPGEAVTFSLGLKNIGAAATSSLTATLQAIGGVREPSAAQNYGALTAGGATVTRTFSFKLDGGCGSSIPLLLKLQDGATDLGFANISIPLGTSASATFTGGAITVNDNTVGSPSPSNLAVSGLVGRVQDMTAQINGLTHTYIDDVGALLHGPDALKIRLFCGGPEAPVSAVNITFDDNAAIVFPFSGALPSGSYKPVNYYSSRVFTGDTAAEVAYTMSEYRGVPADGTWKLYMQDFAAGDSGSLTNWKLFFTTVTCTDNVMLTQAAPSGGEAAGSIAVSVTRTGGKEGSATVNYATSNGTAIAGSDYTTTSGTLTFAAGELVKTFSVPITNDSINEGDETINLTLSSPTGAAVLGTQTTAALTLLDDPPPTVTVSPNGTTTNSAPVSFTLTFAEAVTGLTTSGISVTNGSKGALSGSGTTYTLPVTPGGQGAVTCQVIAAAAQDSAGHDNLVSNTASVTYDTVVPSVVVTPDAISTNNTPITFTLTFSESVTGLAASSIAVTNGTTGALSGSGTTYTLPVTPSGQGPVTCQVTANAAQDAASNNNTASNTSSVNYDTVAPTVAVTPSGTSTNSSPITFTFTFSEAVTGLATSGITVTNGTQGALSGSGTTYTLPVTPSAQGAVTCQVNTSAAQDAAANPNTASNTASVTYDSVAPTVVVTPSGTSTSDSPITFTLTFAEAVTGLSADAIAVGNGTKGALSGSGTTYTLPVTPVSQGSVTCQVTAAAAQDATGNPNTASNTASVTYALSSQQSWRQTYFGTTTNTGNAADSADPDGDGVSNLLEWAGGLNPTTSSTLPTPATVNGASIEFTYTRSVVAVTARAVFTVEWSDTLANDWQTTGVSESILSDNGTVQQVKATLPAGSAGHRFVHLKVTAPP